MYKVGPKKTVHIAFNQNPNQSVFPRCGSFIDPNSIGEVIPAAIPAKPVPKPFRAYAKFRRPSMNHFVISTVTDKLHVSFPTPKIDLPTKIVE